jgi:hypothetical protein
MGDRHYRGSRDVPHSPKVYETYSPLRTYGNAASHVCIAQKALTLRSRDGTLPKRKLPGRGCVTKRSQHSQVCPR